MKEIIIEKLRKIESDNNITILYAVESGSRAWGHYNKNSDYDIRFIYKYNNIKEYLRINSEKDVIESNDGLYDIVGWDIKKSLKLHYKSNPNLREWILSPIKYIENKQNIFEDLPEFNPAVLKHHYYSLANRHYKKYIKNKEDYDFKFLKKLLYTIRCTLAWKILDEEKMPPMNLNDIINESNIDNQLKNKIKTIKDSYTSLDITEIKDDDINYIIKWIIKSLNYMQNDKSKKYIKRDINVYNEKFWNIIKENLSFKK